MSDGRLVEKFYSGKEVDFSPALLYELGEDPAQMWAHLNGGPDANGLQPHILCAWEAVRISPSEPSSPAA